MSDIDIGMIADRAVYIAASQNLHVTEVVRRIARIISCDDGAKMTYIIRQVKSNLRAKQDELPWLI